MPEPDAAAAPIAGIHELYGGLMMPATAVATLSYSDRLLPVQIAPRGATTRALPASAPGFPDLRFEWLGKSWDLYDYVTANRVAGLLVIKAGRVALEHYELGIGPATRWASFSMAKSVCSTLVGAAIADGLIADLDMELPYYLPQLRGSAYGGVSLRQTMLMASGVQWDETYPDPRSERRRLLEAQLAQQPGATLRFMAGLSRAADPGSRWNYNTGETCLVGAVVEAVTGVPLAAYLSAKIWSRAGMEQPAAWWAESPGGMAIGGTGLAATLRDYARFGLFALEGGCVSGVQIVPTDWFAQAGVPHLVGGATVDYGYFWWVPRQDELAHEGAFMARGIFGQSIYVNPRQEVVIVVLSARAKPSASDRIDLDDDSFFAATVRALQ